MLGTSPETKSVFSIHLTDNLTMITQLKKQTLLYVLLAFSGILHATGSQWTNIQDFFPENWQESGEDLKPYIEKAFQESARIFFPGSNEVDNPVIYPVTTGLVVPANTHLKFGPNHRVLRLPSKGTVLMLEDGVHLSGIIIDGNKYNHWPEFQELGKTDYGIRMKSYCVIEDSVVYNNPGIAFGSHGNYNKLYRCLAENAGYIDVKFGVTFYQGNRDYWSADGYYFRGTGNLIKDSEAYDCIRWDFCSSHSGAKQNVYVDCRGGDVNYRTYGFIDIEGADANNRLIRCISPNSHISIPVSNGTEVLQCMATRITAYDRAESIDLYTGQHSDGLLIDGNTTTNGGIVIGGWSSARKQLVAGATSPIITNNKMYKLHGGPSDGYSDYSFSVYSINGIGVVANNILFEYDDGLVKGPGIKLENLEGTNNQIAYGMWSLDLPKISMRYGYVNREHLAMRQQEIAIEALAGLLKENSTPSIDWIEAPDALVADPKQQGSEKGWMNKIPESESTRNQAVFGKHWTHSLGDEYRGVAWYYFNLPESLSDQEDPDLKLFFGGIDSFGKIYLNGQLIGEHTSWSKPSLHDLDRTLLNSQNNLIAVRVESRSGLGGIYGPVAIVR